MQAPSAIRDRFMADHRRLEAIVDQVLAALEANDRDEIRKLWRALESGLHAHFEAEEKHAIPLLMVSGPREGQALLAEHKHLRRRLAELGSEIDLGVARVESLRGFIDELNAHARHEETVLYKWCDDHLEETPQSPLLKPLVEMIRSVLRDHPVAT
jgi:hemerythrin